MKKRTVGMLGLGIMGSAMAANLLRAGYRVVGYDPVAACRRRLARLGGVAVRTPEEVAAAAPILVTSLPSAAALASASKAISGRRIVLETSTLPIADKERARKALAAKGAVLLDCPLSGTGAQAKTGDLLVYASGERAAFRRALPVLRGFSRGQHYLGRFGNGSKMKFVANLLVAIHNVSTAEAMVVGEKAGLDLGLLYRVIGDGAGASRMYPPRSRFSCTVIRGKLQRPCGTKPSPRRRRWAGDRVSIGLPSKRMAPPKRRFNP